MFSMGNKQQHQVFITTSPTQQHNSTSSLSAEETWALFMPGTQDRFMIQMNKTGDVWTFLIWILNPVQSTCNPVEGAFVQWQDSTCVSQQHILACDTIQWAKAHRQEVKLLVISSYMYQYLVSTSKQLQHISTITWPIHCGQHWLHTEALAS